MLNLTQDNMKLRPDQTWPDLTSEEGIINKDLMKALKT